jgi:hypothetical protein
MVHHPGFNNEFPQLHTEVEIVEAVNVDHEADLNGPAVC